MRIERKLYKDKLFSCVMEIEISEDISKNIEKFSQELGIDKKEIVQRAVRFYLHSIVEEENLKEELEAWENAGIEDIEEFEEQQ